MAAAAVIGPVAGMIGQVFGFFGAREQRKAMTEQAARFEFPEFRQDNTLLYVGAGMMAVILVLAILVAKRMSSG